LRLSAAIGPSMPSFFKMAEPTPGIPIAIAPVLHRGPRVADREMRPRKSGSRRTRCWRRQSRANPSLKAKFPVTWENTGNLAL
jgi:hypothetical protein